MEDLICPSKIFRSILLYGQDLKSFPSPTLNNRDSIPIWKEQKPHEDSFTKVVHTFPLHISTTTFFLLTFSNARGATYLGRASIEFLVWLQASVSNRWNLFNDKSPGKKAFSTGGTRVPSGTAARARPPFIGTVHTVLYLEYTNIMLVRL